MINLLAGCAAVLLGTDVIFQALSHYNWFPAGLGLLMILLGIELIRRFWDDGHRES
jgi:hypothetical protein